MSMFFSGHLLQQQQQHPPAGTPPAPQSPWAAGQLAPSSIEPMAPLTAQFSPAQWRVRRQLPAPNWRFIPKCSVLEALKAGLGLQPQYLTFKNKKAKVWCSPWGIDFPGHRGFAVRNFSPLHYCFFLTILALSPSQSCSSEGDGDEDRTGQRAELGCHCGPCRLAAPQFAAQRSGWLPAASRPCQY